MKKTKHNLNKNISFSINGWCQMVNLLLSVFLSVNCVEILWNKIFAIADFFQIVIVFHAMTLGTILVDSRYFIYFKLKKQDSIYIQDSQRKLTFEIGLDEIWTEASNFPLPGKAVNLTRKWLFPIKLVESIVTCR